MTRRKPPAEPVIRTCADPKCGRLFPVHRAWQKKCRERILHEQMRRDARNHRAQLAELVGRKP
jgi:hypothetical protein